jgi:P-type Ca2+ transporter type 2B
MFHPDNIKNK